MCLTIAPPFYPKGCEKQPAIYQTYKALYTEYLVSYNKFLGMDHCCGINGSCDSRCGSHVITRKIISKNFKDSDNHEVLETEKCNSDNNANSEGSLVSTLPRGPNYERNKAVREKKKQAKRDFLSQREVVDSRKKVLELEVLEARLDREKHQAEVSRLFRLRQERVESDAVSVMVQLDIDKNKKLLEKLRVDQQLKLWDSSVEAVDRRKKEIVARSELNIAKYENMKERKLKLQEIERKENWREEANGGGSLPPSVVSSKPSVPSSVSARSSASRGAVSSASSVVSGRPKVSAGVADRLRIIQRRSELLAILDSGGDFECGVDEKEARSYDIERSVAQRITASKLAEEKRNVKKGWF